MQEKQTGPGPQRPRRAPSRRPKKQPSNWPKRMLALLVMGFCVFVAVGSVHLLGSGLAGWNPLDFSTYGPARDAIDEAYTHQMFDVPAAGSQVLDETQPQPSNPIKDALVDLNGLATGTLGKRELNGVIKLDNGYITAFLSEKQDVSHQVNKTVELWQLAQQQGKPFVFVMAPHLIDKFNPMLPAGVADYFNETADDFLAQIAAVGVPAIDLRQLMQDEGFDHYGGFFRTDHHWTPAAASWACHQVLRQLEEWGWLAAPNGLGLSPQDFAEAAQGITFYGTAAQRTGEAFAGEPDVLPCVNPTREVPLSTRRLEEAQYSGPVPFAAVYRAWETANFAQVYGPDAYYFYKTMYEMSVLNESAPVQNSLLLVCDSFGVPFQSYAACYLRQITAFDGRAHGDIAAQVAQNDIVMVLFNPSSLDIRTENATIFNFI